MMSPRSILAVLLMMNLSVFSVTADEPTGASVVFTSADPTIVAALDHVQQGRLREGEALLDAADDDVSARARQEMREIIRRIRMEYSLDVDGLLQRLRNSIPDVTAEDLDRWTRAGQVQHRIIDGKLCYFRREPSNIFRFCEEAKHRRAQAGNAPREQDGWKLIDHLKQVIEQAERTGEVEVAPVRHRITYAVTIPPETSGAKPGSHVRVWLPYPQEYRQQRDIKLISTSPAYTLLAPNGVPQRTIYFEKRVDDPSQPMRFEVIFEYTSWGYYPKLDESKVQPLPEDWNGAYLGERLPHIVFTPELKELVEQIVAGETNPLAKVRKIFYWIDENIRYHAEEEYSVLPSFAAKALERRRGDCGVQGMLFITMCRAAGVPARWQSGWETKRVGWNMHDWAEFYVEPWGWLPADVSYGLQKRSDDPKVRDFYIGHQDSYRLIVNLDYGSELHPPKQSLRSEPADFQRGEVEVDGRNLYFDQWKYEIKIEWLD